MPKLDYTPQNISKTIRNAEQLSLVAMMLLDQELKPDHLNLHLRPILEKLNNDLQDAALLHGLSVACSSGTV